MTINRASQPNLAPNWRFIAQSGHTDEIQHFLFHILVFFHCVTGLPFGLFGEIRKALAELFRQASMAIHPKVY
jgi:hypothetical protein